MEAFFQRLGSQEYLYIASLVAILVVYATLVSRRALVTTEIVASLMFGISYVLFPKQTLGFQMTREPNEKELLLSRLFGGAFMAAGYTWFRTRETRDATVPITLMTSRVVTSSIMVMAQFVSYIASPLYKAEVTNKDSGKKETVSISEWSEKTYIVYAVLPTILWMLIHIIHLLRSHDFNFYPQHNVRLNNNLRIDAWIMLVSGVALMAFPSQIMKTLFTQASVSAVSLHIVRSIGAIAIGEAVTSLQAPGFLHPRDKQAVFTTRIFMELMTIGLLWVGFFYYSLITVTALCYVVVIDLPVLANAAFGNFTDGTTIYSVPTPKKQSDNPPEGERSKKD